MATPTEYEKKLAEMQKFIPFLDSMIARLQNPKNNNPKGAQLSKITSLRDLLLDKNKKMKMENILKCEQVLINLYSKVEKTEIIPINSQLVLSPKEKKSPKIYKKSPGEEKYSPNENRDSKGIEENINDIGDNISNSFQNCREKLKSIVTMEKIQSFITSPKKTPSLFVRRAPEERSHSQSSQDFESNNSTRRNYTRVLRSPEPQSKFSTENRSAAVEEKLFERRSRRDHSQVRSPRKRDRKKSRRRSRSRRRKDDNVDITLNLNEASLNTDKGDILERILKCNEDDEDIDKLKKMRSKILKKLEEVGENEDISKYLLKSYKKSSQKNTEVEEGEITDSDGDLEKLYGGLVVEVKDEQSKKTMEENRVVEKPRIKISLIISNKSREEQDQKVEPSSSAESPKTHMTDIDMRKRDEKDNDKNTDDAMEDKKRIILDESSTTIMQSDILKALSKDILSDGDDSQAESIPALHQPKISKISDRSVLDIDKKRRISIGEYKEKGHSSKPPSIFPNTSYRSAKYEEEAKRLSKALTAKEFERFHNILINTISDNICDPETQVADDAYISRPGSPLDIMCPSSPVKEAVIVNESCPKSPEIKDELIKDTPTIIPSDPVKEQINKPSGDTDMRILSMCNEKSEVVKESVLEQFQFINEPKSNVTLPRQKPHTFPLKSSTSSSPIPISVQQPVLTAIPPLIPPPLIPPPLIQTTFLENTDDSNRFSYNNRRGKRQSTHSTSFQYNKPANNTYGAVNARFNTRQLARSMLPDPRRTPVWEMTPSYNPFANDELTQSPRRNVYADFSSENELKLGDDDYYNRIEPRSCSSDVRLRYGNETRLTEARSCSQYSRPSYDESKLYMSDPRSSFNSESRTSYNEYRRENYRDHFRESSVNRYIQREQPLDRLRSELGRDDRLLRETSVNRSLDYRYNEFYSHCREETNSNYYREREVQRDRNFNQDEFHVESPRYLVCDPRRGRSFYTNKTHLPPDNQSSSSTSINESRHERSKSVSRTDDATIASNKMRYSRAKSVGRDVFREHRDASARRNLLREGSVGRTTTKNSFSGYQPRPKFTRSKSVGPAPSHSQRSKSEERNLLDEFKNLRSQTIVKDLKTTVNDDKTLKSSQESLNICLTSDKNLNVKITKKPNPRDPKIEIKDQLYKQDKRPKFRHTRFKYDSSTSYKKDFSTTKYNKIKDRGQSNNYSSSRKQSGIVYTSDNIAKGKILSPGFGVKNYKIPKIRKLSTEEVKTEQDSISESETQLNVIEKQPDSEPKLLDGKIKSHIINVDPPKPKREPRGRNQEKRGALNTDKSIIEESYDKKDDNGSIEKSHIEFCQNIANDLFEKSIVFSESSSTCKSALNEDIKKDLVISDKTVEHNEEILDKRTKDERFDVTEKNVEGHLTTLPINNATDTKPCDEPCYAFKNIEDIEIPSSSDTNDIERSNDEPTQTDETMPDSTNNGNVTQPDNKSISDFPDSTNTAEVSSENKFETETKYELGNILSILQDKSKLREILSMLPDNTLVTEKIKKTLSKLTEVESDEDNTSVETSVNNEPEVVPKSEENVNIFESEKEADVKIAEESSSEIQINQTMRKNSKIEPISLDISLDNIIETNDSSNKRITRKMVSKVKTKNASRGRLDELSKLQADLKDMFNTGGLNMSGIRMCRMNKMNETEEKTDKRIEAKEQTKSTISQDKSSEKVVAVSSPKVVLEKTDIMEIIVSEFTGNSEKKEKPQNLFKKKRKIFRKRRMLGSFKQANKSPDNVAKEIPDHNNSQGDKDSMTVERTYVSEDTSDDEFIVRTPKNKISKKSIKKKCKMSSWKLGTIKKIKTKAKNLDKKTEKKSADPYEFTDSPKFVNENEKFTDVDYHFSSALTSYPCKLCEFRGESIVYHYKTKHPNVEVAISRLDAKTADRARRQSVQTDFDTHKSTITTKFSCRFCTKLFEDTNIETFFWHIVCLHTGEYKTFLSSDSRNTTHVPSPPDKGDNLLLGYMCSRCLFTQVSIENLKTHVALRHSEEETRTFIINLNDIPINKKKSKICSSELRNVDVNNMLPEEDTGLVRSLRSKKRLLEDSEECKGNLKESSRNEIKRLSPDVHIENDSQKVRQKITFEDELAAQSVDSSVPNIDDIMEGSDSEDETVTEVLPNKSSAFAILTPNVDLPIIEQKEFSQPSNLSKAKPLKSFLLINEEGNQNSEYGCRIEECKFKTPLLISFKKHVQMKHKNDQWNGLCFYCDNTFDGSSYLEYALHFIEVHKESDDTFEPIDLSERMSSPDISGEVGNQSTQKPTIQLRPIGDLLENPSQNLIKQNEATEIYSALPRIESVVSLNDVEVSSTLSTPLKQGPKIVRLSPQELESVLPGTVIISKSKMQLNSPEKKSSEEETQETVTKLTPNSCEKILNEKIAIVKSAVTTRSKFIHIFKCAGKYCSFTSQDVDSFLRHIQAHLANVSRDNSDVCRCFYCGFVSGESAVDLTSHIFKEHSYCAYGCDSCAYIATTPIYVEIHQRKRHPEVAAKVVLKMDVLNPNVESYSTTGMLTRLEAAPFYLCAIGQCVFKGITIAMLKSHIDSVHPAQKSLYCSFCNKEFNKFSLLIIHLQKHGIGLYQCTFCLHGADTEMEMLEHMSEVHSNKRSQAYLRTLISAKDSDGNPTAKYKALPLVHIDRKVNNVVEVNTQTKDDPIKETERAQSLEEMYSATQITVVEPVQKSLGEQLHIEADVKMEIVDVIQKPDVICLDSDSDDNYGENIVTASDDYTALPSISTIETILPSTSSGSELFTTKHSEKNSVSIQKLAKFPATKVFMCAKCSRTCKSEHNYRNHLRKCLSKGSDFKCPHCSASFKKFMSMRDHLLELHTFKILYKCSLCSLIDNKVDKIQKHILKQHNRRPKTVTLYDKNENENEQVYIVQADDAEPSLGVSSIKTPRSCTSKRYGPEHLHLLPINHLFEDIARCARCEFSTKVRINMIRHLQQHQNEAPAPSAAPVNPVPHLETNEMYFDRMTNLASSSMPGRQRVDKTPNVDMSKYPKYVPPRERLVCGAEGCAYISLDEGILRKHWDALHNNTPSAEAYRCAHCPPTQKLDRSRPLTSSRIVAHLRMHDDRLYGCLSTNCPYYHHQKHMVEKHISDKHPSENVLPFTIREPNDANTISTTPPVLSTPSSNSGAAPTMDLKKWHCGLCEFSNPLRSEVIEHCEKEHFIKCRYRCAHCFFDNNLIEKLFEHLKSKHFNNISQPLHVYYQEGKPPDDNSPDPLWQIQRETLNKLNASEKAVVIKQEPECLDNQEIVLNEEELIHKYGTVGHSVNGLYSCPFCKTYKNVEKEGMIDHLYEELNYRSWCCEMCSYRAYNKSRLMDHLQSDHKLHSIQGELIQKHKDINIENWVDMVVDVQDKEISIYLTDSSREKQWSELESVFGVAGEPVGASFSCQRCEFTTEDRHSLEDHLMRELEIFSWKCSGCNKMFQYYPAVKEHASQHKINLGPVIRVSQDLKRQWIQMVLEKQTTQMKNSTAVTELQKLLVQTENLKPSAEPITADAQDLLVIRKESTSQLLPKIQLQVEPDGRIHCPKCSYNSTNRYYIKSHLAAHLRIKLFQCSHCEYGSTKPLIVKKHISAKHPNEEDVTVVNNMDAIQIENDNLNVTPGATTSQGTKRKLAEDFICLECHKYIDEDSVHSHSQKAHNGALVQILRADSNVIVCEYCSTYNVDSYAANNHHASAHAGQQMKIKSVKLYSLVQEVKCLRCEFKCSTVNDFNQHHSAKHPKLQPQCTHREGAAISLQKKLKSVARKSTTKLPTSKSNMCARKSTTKLPFTFEASSDDNEDGDDKMEIVEEYSYYGTQALPLAYFSHINTKIAFYGSLVPFKVDKLKNIFNLTPVVNVQDILKDKSKLCDKYLK